LINWIINTAGKNLYGLYSGTTGGIFGGSIFYPYKNVLAYSEMFFISASWAYPLAKWMLNPAAVSGVVLVVGQVVTMLIIYEWWKKLAGNRWSAAVATVAFGLSQERLEYQVHLQMWSMQYWLIGCWLLTDGVKDRKDWKLFLGAGLLGLQVWESVLPIYFAALIIGAKLIIDHCSLFNKRILFALLIFGVVAAVPLAAYWGVGREFDYQRSIRDAANNGLGVDEIWGKFGSPGLYILLLIAIIEIANSKLQITNYKQALNSNHQILNRDILWLGLVLATSLIMAFGPVLKWGGKTVKIAGRLPVPLPYAVAYYAVPGFGALRTPSRWIWITGWAASGLIALGLSTSLSDLPPCLGGRRKEGGIKKVWAAIGLMFLAILGGVRIMRVRAVPGYKQTPEVYKWLSTQPGKVIAIIPMYPTEEEIDRLPYLYVHQKYTLNGFSGFYPPKRMDEAVRWTANFPGEETIKEMRGYGVEYVVLEKQKIMKYAMPAGRQDLRDMSKNKIWEDGEYAVYKI
jgi:hypothetical protein